MKDRDSIAADVWRRIVRVSDRSRLLTSAVSGSEFPL
jgi:hypothetical protein